MCAFTACVRFLRRRGPAGLRELRVSFFLGYSPIVTFFRETALVLISINILFLISNLAILKNFLTFQICVI